MPNTSEPKSESLISRTRGGKWTLALTIAIGLVAALAVFVTFSFGGVGAVCLGGLTVVAVVISTAVVGILLSGLKEWTLWANDHTNRRPTGWNAALREQFLYERPRGPWDFVFKPATMAVGSVETFGAMLLGNYYLMLNSADRWQPAAIIGGWFTVKSLATEIKNLDTDHRLYFGNQVRHFFVFGTLLSIGVGFALGLAYYQVSHSWLIPGLHAHHDHPR